MRFFIIAATLIHLSAASAAPTVGRCCKKGEILVLNDAKLECVPRSTDQQLQQQRILDASPDGPANGLPYCAKHSHLEQILVDDAPTELPSEACLELFHDESSSLNFAVFVHCSSPPRIPSTRRIQHSRLMLQAATLKSAPRIVHLRKCCPGNTAYDPESKFCRDTATDVGTDFRVLFDRLPSLDFIDVYVHGPPNCHDAAVLADFRLEQLYHSDTDAAGEITISIPQRGFPTNVTINANISCLDSYEDQLIARVCRELDYCEENVCIRKCCSDSVGLRCAAAAATFQNFSNALGDIKNYGLLVGIPCELVFDPDDKMETWSLDDRGNVILEPLDKAFKEVFTHVNSCLEYQMDQRGFSPMLCIPDDAVDHTPPEKWKIGGGLQVISCFFLAATFTVYCCLPSLQNLHGKTLMCHVASLFIAYAILATTEFSTESLGLWGDEVAEDIACKTAGYTLMLAFLSSFFWLNVMCFDIWWTFRGIREAKRHRQTSRFLAYCAYAWGSALFFVVLLLSLDLGRVVKDVVGKQRCWLEYHSMVHVVFFLLPVNLTLLANLFFFLITARRCSMVKAEINRAMANDDKCAKNFRSDRSRLIMNAKLFVVMGIPYLFENLEAFLENYNLMPTWAREVLYVVDTVTSLQGVWIFIMFVLKSKVYEALRKRVSSSNFTVGKSTTSNNLSTNNKLNQPRVRNSASNTSITSCFLST